MTATGKTTEQGPTPWEEAILDLLRTAYPDALHAAEIRNALAMQGPEWGYNRIPIDRLIKRLEERGFVERTAERGPWKLTVT